MGALRDDLAASAQAVRETHISWVFLGDTLVHKVKKPVALGFLDFSTLEQRKAACEAEVSLNRRLAPAIYLGVVPVTLDAHDRHVFGGDGPVVDWAVQMQRLCDENASHVRLAQGRLHRYDVRRVAEHIAAFHARARCDEHTSRFGTIETIRHNVSENFAQTRDTASAHLSPQALAEIERWQLAFLDEHATLLQQRVAQGHIRDGHGDLRLEHVYIRDDAAQQSQGWAHGLGPGQGGGEINIIDCIEFNERFRYGDTCSDLAFLSMDLLWHDAPGLSETLLAAYARASNDYDLYALVDFYESYRAYVRGKIATFLANDPQQPTAVRERAHEQARRFLLLAQASEREPLAPPVLYAVGGLIGSGKSTLANALGDALDAPVIDADRTRKFLAGVAPTTKLDGERFTGDYAPERTEAVYAEVLRRAEVVLRSGRPVVLDASFRSAALREAARKLAQQRGVAFRFVECCAPRAVLQARLRAREARPTISDGRLDLLDDFTAAWEPVTELAQDEHVQIDTSRNRNQAVRAALRPSDAQRLRSTLPATK